MIEKWTFYDDRPTHDWPNSMLDIFYPDMVDREFFEDHAQMDMEIKLLYKVMEKVHLMYFGYDGNPIPRITQKIPYSSRWKETARYNLEYKSPRDYDKKRGIMQRYDSDYFRL